MINYIGAFYYTHDGLGNITEITNYAGGLLEYYTYDVYGQPTLFDETSSQINSSFIDNPFFFTGRDCDIETGLYYYRARHYSPTLGRFLETDPLGYVDSMNLFAYVVNNPWNIVDPMGLSLMGNFGPGNSAGSIGFSGGEPNFKIGKGIRILIGTIGTILGILGGPEQVPGTGKPIGPRPPIVAPGKPEDGKGSKGKGGSAPAGGGGNSSGNPRNDMSNMGNLSNSGALPNLGPLPSLGALPNMGPLPSTRPDPATNQKERSQCP